MFGHGLLEQGLVLFPGMKAHSFAFVVDEAGHDLGLLPMAELLDLADTLVAQHLKGALLARRQRLVPSWGPHPALQRRPALQDGPRGTSLPLRHHFLSLPTFVICRRLVAMQAPPRGWQRADLVIVHARARVRVYHWRVHPWAAAPSLSLALPPPPRSLSPLSLALSLFLPHTHTHSPRPLPDKLQAGQEHPKWSPFPILGIPG